jgi:hypothetical protein
MINPTVWYSGVRPWYRLLLQWISCCVLTDHWSSLRFVPFPVDQHWNHDKFHTMIFWSLGLILIYINESVGCSHWPLIFSSSSCGKHWNDQNPTLWLSGVWPWSQLSNSHMPTTYIRCCGELWRKHLDLDLHGRNVKWNLWVRHSRMRDICGGNAAHMVLPSELGRACFQCHPLPLTASTAVEIRRSRALGFQQWLPVGLLLLILLPPSLTIRSSWTQLGSSD